MEDRSEQIKAFIEKGYTLKQIGSALGGVSRQRVYQLMMRYGIETPERKKKGFWKSQTPELKWLQRTMCSRGISGELRSQLYAKYKEGFPTHCPILGVPLVYGNVGVRGEDSASLDQRVPGDGYTIDNTDIICWRANRIKNDGTLQDFVKIVDYLS